MRLTLLTVAAAVAVACEVTVPTAPSSTVSGGGDMSYCADRINQYRASAGRAPLARSSALEDFAAQSAQSDGLAHVAHIHFTQTNGAGTALAETEILWWQDTGVSSVIERGLAQMWQQGPSGEHYDIINGPYTQVGCGVFVNGTEVTVTQDFR